MCYNIVRILRLQLALSVAFALAPQLAFAANSGPITGSYYVVRTTAVGDKARVEMHIHLVNRGSSQLSIRRMTLWSFSHPEKGGSRACAVIVPAHASTDTTQEFTLRRSDYHLWNKGFRPRLILRIGSADRRASIPKSTAVVRLDPISGQEAK